ncbi:MAG TPA: MT-A70 family methyltransferase [bacterium]
MSDPYQFLPPLSRAEYEALKADIAARGGLHSPVVVDENGQVLDGHHRLKACEELGIDPTVDQRPFPSEAHKEAFALASNLSRRQLSPEQRSTVREYQRQVYLDLRQAGCKQEEAAGLVGVPQQTGSYWETQSNTSTGIALVDQRLSVPKPARQFIYDRRAAGEALSSIAADYKVTAERIGQIVRQVEAAMNVPQPAVTPGFPEGPFKCITLDPPWPMPKIEREVRPDQGAHLDYPTMTLEEIEELPIPGLADQQGAHVYLWVTHKFLPAGLKLFEAWEVRYQCLMTWRKNVGPTPFSWMYDTEHVLFGRVGDLPLQRNGLRLSFEAPAIGHSVKPAVFYERVCQATPGPRLAMFERGEREGFEVWGTRWLPMRTWQDDFQWQRGYLKQMKRICGEYLIGEAPREEDVKRNTDLIVLRMEPVRIACRVRDYAKYRQRYGSEFTIRYRRSSGVDTELDKIRDGWGDYMLYGFGQPNGHFRPWGLGDLDVFRDWYQPGCGTERRNGDRSSDFLAFRWDQLPADFVIAKSDGVQMSLGGAFG